MTILLVTEDLAIQRRFEAAVDLSTNDTLYQCATLDDIAPQLRHHADIKILVVDFGLPGLGGLKEVGRLKKAHADLRIVLLLHTASLPLARQALRLGVTACLHAVLPTDDLRAALRLAQGQNEAIILPKGSLSVPDKNSLLSRREEQILALLCDGQQNKEIAHTFGIQEVTVKMHMRSVIRKLGARNRTHAAMIARDRGLV